MLIFTAEHRYVRTVPLAARPSSPRVLPNGNLVVSAMLPTPELIGVPFHLLDYTGSVIRSFGFQRAVPRPDSGRGAVMQFWLGADNTSVWIATRYAPGTRQYGIQQLRFDGTAGAGLRVYNVPWLSSAGIRRLDTVVQGRLMSIALSPATATFAGIDSAGHFWFNGSVWPDDYSPQSVAAGARVTPSNRLEVIDLASRELLVSQEFPHVVQFLPGSSLAYSTTTSASGVHTYHIWRLALRRGG
jgi:hypothetical protein